jgi:hypothetical protein
MAETKAQSRPAAKRTTATSKSRAGGRKEHEAKSGVEQSTELSEDVLQALEDGGRAAIEAVRKFAATVDKALPPRGQGPSRREEITDSALEMAQRLVHTQYEFLRKVVDSAGKSLSGSDDGK